MKLQKYLLSAFTLMLATVASAATSIVTIDSLKYKIDTKNNEAMVMEDDYSSYKTITIPSSISYKGKDYPVTSLEEWCFWNCDSLTSIELPSSIKSLGSLCFYGCKSLTSINIPSSVTSLGEYCFSDCN